MYEDEFRELVAVREEMVLALAVCSRCQRRYRILPCDILPWKTYALQVIGHLGVQYVQGREGLRTVVYGLHGHSPAHTTLHGWTEGLGAYVLGRAPGEVSGALRAGQVLEETERRHSKIRAIRTGRHLVDPGRYRSEERRMRLKACSMFLACSLLLGGLAGWAGLILRELRSSPIGFRSSISCTAIEHVKVQGGVALSPSQQRKEGRCNEIPGKSPPGASNKSPPSSTKR